VKHLAFVLTLAALPAFADVDAKAVFDQRCQKCHDADGSGHTKMGKKMKAPDFRRERWQKHNDDDEIQRAITDGIKEHGKTRMPAFKEKLKPEEIKALVAYVRTFAKAGAAEEKPADEKPAAEAKPAEEKPAAPAEEKPAAPAEQKPADEKPAGQ
jgi:mono/diheme cytochrome c family protein